MAVALSPDAQRKKALQALAALGGQSVGDESITYEGDRFIVPKAFEGKLSRARQFLREQEDALNEKHDFHRTYPYRPYDGAAAFERAMVKVFGTSGRGKVTVGMFGDKHPPQYIGIGVSHTETIQVPWGEVSLDLIDATFQLAGHRDRENGIVFQLHCEAPRLHKAVIQGFFDLVGEELKTGSIYKGKALDGRDGAEPGFINPYAVNPDDVVYTANALEQLDASLWSVIDYADTSRQLGLSLKRAVLLEGPYGTGKTLAGGITARHAVDNGWTFILVRAEDDPYEALRTARLYAPAVVWIEDIDMLTAGDRNRADITRLLDTLDSVNSKGKEIMVGFTSNFADKIDKGVLRPGRIDAVIHVGALDRPKFEKLVKVLVPAHLLDPAVDWDAVAAAMEGFLPAYTTEAATRAIRYSIARNHGKPDVIGTADLVASAMGLREQLELMEGAGEAAHGNQDIGSLIRGEVEGTLKRTSVDGEEFEVAPLNGHHN